MSDTLTSTSSYTCPYCRLDSDAAGTSCPHCGAPVDIRAKVSASGWERQPAIRDLARIQFGRSTCQVSGTYVPVAELRLAAGESVFFSHHVLLWADTEVRLAQQQLTGAWNRMKAGMPLVMLEATGPGALALSDDHAGEMIAVPLVPGRTIDVREHRFLTATPNVAYSWFQSGIWYRTRSGDETETHYPAGMYMDRFEATDTPGLLLLHSPGNVFVRDLAPGEAICIHPGALLWKDTSADMSLHLERARGSFWMSSWRPTTPWLRVVGPGRVAMSSVFERLEGTGSIVGTSRATTVDWNQQALVRALTGSGPGGAGAGLGVGNLAGLTTPGFDVAAVNAALDAAAAEHGLPAGTHTTAGPMASSVYAAGTGTEVRVDVTGASAADAIAKKVSEFLAGSGTGIAGAAGRLIGGFLRKRGAKGAPAPSTAGGGAGADAPGHETIEGLGDQAYWRPSDAGGDLVATGSGRHVHVHVTSPSSDDDRKALAHALAVAALAAG